MSVASDPEAVAACGQPWCGVSEDGGRWPMSVAVIDAEAWVDGAVGDVGGGSYRYRSLLVRAAGRPRGVLCVPAGHDHRIVRDQLDRCVRRSRDPVDSEPLLLASDMLPPITVVVCTIFDRSQALLECLASLDALEGRAAEILVVDNRRRSDPRARRLVEAIPGARLLHEPRPGLAAARNHGLRAARSGIVAFTDDDAVVDALWLRAIATRLRAHPEEVGTCGLVLPRHLQTPAQVRLESYRGGFGPRGMTAVTHRLAQRPPRPPLISAIDGTGRRVQTFPLYRVGRLGVGANMAFRTAPLLEAGGFDECLGAGTPSCGGEDIELFVRLIWTGACLGFEPAAIVLHEHRRSEAELRTQMRQYGIGFTATLAALLCRDPRHALGMAATAAAMLRSLLAAACGGRPRGVDGRPRRAETAGAAQLRHLEFRGRLRGPDAFLRSWLRTRGP